MIRHLRSVAAGAAIIVTLAVAPAPASAFSPWNAAPCATGGFGPLEFDDHQTAILPGQVTICGRWASKYAFTAVSFRPDRNLGLAFTSHLRPYAEAGPTPVRAAFVSPPAVGSTGVCLMRSTTDRIACLAVDTDSQYRITARPIRVDDPLVTKPVLYQDDSLSPGTGDMYCATCVSLP